MRMFSVGLHGYSRLVSVGLNGYSRLDTAAVATAASTTGTNTSS